MNEWGAGASGAGVGTLSGLIAAWIWFGWIFSCAIAGGVEDPLLSMVEWIEGWGHGGERSRERVWGRCADCGYSGEEVVEICFIVDITISGFRCTRCIQTLRGLHFHLNVINSLLSGASQNSRNALKSPFMHCSKRPEGTRVASFPWMSMCKSQPCGGPATRHRRIPPGQDCKFQCASTVFRIKIGNLQVLPNLASFTVSLDF